RSGAPVTTASPAYAAATILLHLATAVAVADGTIDENEQQHLITHLETSLELTLQERARLHAHLRWLGKAGAKLTGLRARIDTLTMAQREVIARFVVRIAAADGIIAPTEVTTVTKIYKLLGMDPATVPAALHGAAAPVRPRPAVEPVVVRPGTTSGSYIVPARPRGRHSCPTSNAPGTTLELDPALIEAKLAETSAVAELLTAIFTDDEPPTPFAGPPPAGPAEQARGGPTYPASGDRRADTAPAAPEPGASAGDDVVGLDTAHTRLLRALTQRPTWSRADYEDLAERSGLLPEGALDRLNEAAYELLGEPLLEGDDPLSINDDAAQEMLA
ncbi:MAG: hypothetical protein QG597_3193, partial [Actinomycetota bacterium]|nr:hypothetical protein [Actinomycetota bacterium]